MDTAERADPAERVPWYHTIELPNGPTAGEYDLRPTVAKLPFPALDGMRCLDVGTHDGFWAFQMEAMGAEEVVACDISDPEDIDWPEPRPIFTAETRASLTARKAKFRVAHEARRSRVVHHYVSVYDLSQDRLGAFDFVFIGSLLQHLRDPVGALMAARRVTRGSLLLCANVSVSKSLLYRTIPLTVLAMRPGEPFWQVPNLVGIYRQLESAGFEVIRRGPIHLQWRGPGVERPSVLEGLRNWRELPGRALHRFGVPHVGVLARPVGS